tara:strand:+ start:8271 stop:8873 length:603 start_codon:yes stop_codon:yes gene_type:complete
MKLISHRRNTIPELLETDTRYGVEVDIRSNNNKLIIHHDPFSHGVDFEEWLSFYNHDTLILNVKEEGLEEKLLDLMKDYEVKDFFFLDQSFPFLIKWTKLGESRSAIRFSEYESIDTALSLEGKADWIWIDCFNHFPLSKEQFLRLKEAKFKLCLVSPELQGRHSTEEILDMHEFLTKNEIIIDAVCTKKMSIWEELETI